MATYLKTGYLDLDTVNIPHHIITNIVVAENGNDVFANFLAYHMNLPLFMAGTDFTNLKSLLLGAGLMETALRNTSPVDVAINSSITFGQILNTVPTLALFDAMSAYFGSNLAAIQQLCNSPSCKITLAQHMYTADFDAFMPILFQTDFMKAQTVWSTFMAGPIPPNMNLAVSTLKANVNFQLLLRTIVDVFDCNYVLAQYLVYKGPIAFRNQIGTYVDLKNCYRNVFGDYFLANIMDLYGRQLLWTHMFATHPAGFWADILISVNPTEFGRIAFKYFPNEANQLMINANISITDYFSLIESCPALGNAYLSNLKNTLMNMGYTAAGWTYLADEHHIYGSSRVGVHNTNFVLAKRFSTAEMEYTQKTGNQVHFIRGKRNYELSNHLGNVQVVITDKRISVCDNELQTERFEADILMATDYYPFGMAIPERQWYTGSDSSNYRFGFNTQEKVDEISGKGNHNSAKFWEYEIRLGRRWNLDPKPTVGISDYACFYNNPIWNTDVLGDKPTKKEAAAISAHVYGDQKDGILRGGWKVSERDFGIEKNSKDGLKSQVYERTITSGKRKGEIEYVYATAGTEDWTDIAEDVSQPLGVSKQYEQSIANAKLISDQLGKGTELTFTGHSLGGGEAAANAYATGRDAITFNAAGVSPLTQKANPASKIDAYIMKTDPLNLVQNGGSLIGLLMPDVDGTRHYEMSYSDTALKNGHSMDNFLSLYKISPTFYKK